MRCLRLVTSCVFVLVAFHSIGWTTPISPGFEQGPDVSILSFTPNDDDNLGWFASHTDGERIKTTGSKPAAEGDFYAGLLQNGDTYDGTPLGIDGFGIGFDRIYATFAVLPNTTYDVSFQHAGDNRFGYLPDTSVVEVVDVTQDTTITLQTFPTPGLFDWQTVNFQFTTGAPTNTAAIAFTVMGFDDTSGVFDDIQIQASVIPEPSTYLLFAIGLVAIVGMGYRRRRRLVANLS